LHLRSRSSPRITTPSSLAPRVQAHAPHLLRTPCPTKPPTLLKVHTRFHIYNGRPNCCEETVRPTRGVIRMNNGNRTALSVPSSHLPQRQNVSCDSHRIPTALFVLSHATLRSLPRFVRQYLFEHQPRPREGSYLQTFSLTSNHWSHRDLA